MRTYYDGDEDIPEDTPSIEHPHFDLLRSESYVSPQEQRWEAWVRKVEKILGHDLDGDQDRDGYSLDYAGDVFDAGTTAEQYAAEVLVGAAARNIIKVEKILEDATASADCRPVVETS